MQMSLEQLLCLRGQMKVCPCHKPSLLPCGQHCLCPPGQCQPDSSTSAGAETGAEVTLSWQCCLTAVHGLCPAAAGEVFGVRHKQNCCFEGKEMVTAAA